MSKSKNTNQKQPTTFNVQIGGDWYKKMPVQLVEFCHKNRIPYVEGNVIKYMVRWREKGGIEDLKKAKHYIDLILEMNSDKS